MSMDQNASHAASDGAVSQRGRRVPPQGVGGYDQNWYPLCLSSDVPAGSVKGYDFLNGRVIAFRGESGALAVTSAYCRHLGADLSGGDVIGDDIRCPYHHWSYAKSGACVKTATGDKPSASARLFKFPVEEKWGLVWVFNGEEPLYEVPHFSEHAEEELTYRPSREDEAIEQLIAMGQAFGRQLITEDTPIFERIRFSQDVLNASDRGLSIYLNHVRKYPRANPAGDLII